MPQHLGSWSRFVVLVAVFTSLAGCRSTSEAEVSAQSKRSESAAPTQRGPEVSQSAPPSVINLADAGAGEPARPPRPRPSGPSCPPCPAGSLCMLQLGHPGPVRRDEPPPTPSCVPIPAGCAQADCSCLAGPHQRCTPSETQAGVCTCDNGMR